MPIKLNDITPRQKLTIAKGLLDYQFIMENRKTDSADFRAVYYDFYLSSRWAVMSKQGNAEPYFKKLNDISSNDDFVATDILIAIIEELKEETEQHNYEFSLCSKMLHTVNPSYPIYDSKVREYLSKEENVEFWYNSGKSAIKNMSKSEIIAHDWTELCKWYENFLPSHEGSEWIKWFDENFPDYTGINDVKKIDFIIFAST